MRILNQSGAYFGPVNFDFIYKECKNMKTKTYVLTEIEILVIREALDRYYFDFIKNRRSSVSPIMEKMQKAVKPLLDQFKNDYSCL